MIELKVKIPEVKKSSYHVHIGCNLESVWEMVQADFGDCDKFIVTDDNVAKAGHLKKLVGNNDVGTHIINPPGEISKNIDTVVAIIEAMEKASLGRDCVIIAIGGGTVGDIAGFCAAIFKRGIKVVHVPTTTVAQADSAIGGKTGVDSTLSKNAFGAFWQPGGVFVDVKTLSTLDDRQYRAGLVESVKHALIADAKYFDFLEENIDAVLSRNEDVLIKIAENNCRIKATVVEADPTEKNQRRMLNYGHTIGHAVESASGYELLHGEAVAIGIIAAGMIEIEMGLGDLKRLKRVKSLLEKLGVPTNKPKDLDKDELMAIIERDKKAINKWPKFILIDKIGSVYCHSGQWAVDVDRQLVEKLLDKI